MGSSSRRKKYVRITIYYSLRIYNIFFYQILGYQVQETLDATNHIYGW